MHVLHAARNAFLLAALLGSGLGVQAQAQPAAQLPNGCNPLVYPPLSKRANEEGRVLLTVSVGPDGSVDDVVVKQSSGFRRLDTAAMQYVLDCKFVPTHNGLVNVIDVPIAFSMGKEER